MKNKKLKLALLKSGIVLGIATTIGGLGLLAYTMKNPEKFGIIGGTASIFASYALFMQVGPLTTKASLEFHEDTKDEIKRQNKQKKSAEPSLEK